MRRYNESNLKKIYIILNPLKIIKISYLSYLSNPKNRFFDKSYELIICKNAMIGSNIEV